MKKRKPTEEIRFFLSVTQILGIILMVTGLAMLFGFGLAAYRCVDIDMQSALAARQDEIDAGISIDIIEDEIVSEGRIRAAAKLPFLLLGGILIIASVPLFYAPYSDGIVIHKRRETEPEQPRDTVFDDEGYVPPEDDLSYISDPALRRAILRRKGSMSRR